MPSATSARPRRSSAEWSRPSTTSCWTFPTATHASSKRTPRRRPRRSATVTSRRSRSWVGCPGASSTTTRDWRWPGSWETAGASVLVCSLNWCPTTCSMTDSAVQARVTTRARWRGWWDMLAGTSWCLCPRSRASMPSTPTWRSGAWSGWGDSCVGTGRR